MKKTCVLLFIYLVAIASSLNVAAVENDYRTRIGNTIFIKSIEIPNPYLIEYNKNYYLVDGDKFYLNEENLIESLRKRMSFATFIDYHLDYVFLGLNAVEYEMLQNARVLDLIETQSDIIQLKSTTNGNVYKYANNLTYFLVFLVQIQFYNNILDPDSQYSSPPKKFENMIESNMPESEYILFACPLKSKPNQETLRSLNK